MCFYAQKLRSGITPRPLIFRLIPSNNQLTQETYPPQKKGVRVGVEGRWGGGVRVEVEGEGGGVMGEAW